MKLYIILGFTAILSCSFNKSSREKILHKYDDTIGHLTDSTKLRKNIVNKSWEYVNTIVGDSTFIANDLGDIPSLLKYYDCDDNKNEYLWSRNALKKVCSEHSSIFKETKSFPIFKPYNSNYRVEHYILYQKKLKRISVYNIEKSTKDSLIVSGEKVFFDEKGRRLNNVRHYYKAL